MNFRNGTHRGPIAWMCRHGVAPNLLMAFLIIGGLLMSMMIRKEFIPPYEADAVIIRLSYPGATPAELEQGAVLPIENELASLDGLKQISASVNPGSARITVELQNGIQRQQAWQDIQQAVSAISTFPARMETPTVALAGRSIEVMEMALFGPMDRFAMKRLAEQVKAELLAVPEISKVELRGMPAEEIHVEVSQVELQRYGLTLDDIARKISSDAVELSAGTLKTPAGDVLVALDERRYWAHEFSNLTVHSSATGSTLQLADIATVTEGFGDANRLVTYNGMEAVRFDIHRSENQTPLTVTTAAHRVIDDLRSRLPAGADIVVTDDDGKTYSQRLGLLLKNAAIGLILVLVLLSLFLEYRLAFWVTMGIPTAFLGALLLLPAADISINMVSMFAFIVALGIVVDDAIIAGENIYEHMQQGMPFEQAAIVGAKEVSVPLAFAILTNVVAFLPLLALPGFMGKLFLAIPTVVICCFVISWIEALFILPTHLAGLKRRDEQGESLWIDRVQQGVDGALGRFIQQVYQPLLLKVIKQPGLTLAVAVSICLCVLAWAASGRMGFSMFPRLEGEFTVAQVDLPANAPFEQALAVRTLLEQRLYDVVVPIEQSDGKLLISAEGSIDGSRVEVEARLVDSEVRPITAHELARRWREVLGDIPGIRSLAFDAERGGGPSSGAALTVELRSSDSGQLRLASEELAGMLGKISGVTDIANSYTSGKPQWDVELNALGRSLGLDSATVASQLRAALYGSRALRQQRQRNEVTVLVRIPENERRYTADIGLLKIRTPAGGYVPLQEIAVLTPSFAPANISRRDGERIVKVTAAAEPRSQIPALMTELEQNNFPLLQARYPGVEFGFRGRQADTRESMSAMQLYGAFALIGIYALLAIPFRSYSQPLLVMLVIPFGFAGSIIGHLMLGYGLSIISVMGMVALAGVVVNDSLILVDYANRQRREKGMATRDAICTAGVRRFRPILLTTLTTFGGLAPMVFEASRQAQFITPMAVSLGFGILFTTFVCLLILPALYVLVDDFQLGITRLFAHRNAGPDEIVR